MVVVDPTPLAQKRAKAENLKSVQEFTSSGSQVAAQVANPEVSWLYCNYFVCKTKLSQMSSGWPHDPQGPLPVCFLGASEYRM